MKTIILFLFCAMTAGMLYLACTNRVNKLFPETGLYADTDTAKVTPVEVDLQKDSISDSLNKIHADSLTK